MGGAVDAVIRSVTVDEMSESNRDQNHDGYQDECPPATVAVHHATNS